MARERSAESAEKRVKRIEERARKRREAGAAADDSADEMVRRSIKDHGA